LSITDARIHRFPHGFGALEMAIAGAAEETLRT
jgi:hypothetical protein